MAKRPPTPRAEEEAKEGRAKGKVKAAFKQFAGRNRRPSGRGKKK